MADRYVDNFDESVDFYPARISDPDTYTPQDMSEFLAEWDQSTRTSTFKSQRYGTGSNLPVDRASFDGTNDYTVTKGYLFNQGVTKCSDTLWPGFTSRDVYGAPSECFNREYDCESTYASALP